MNKNMTSPTKRKSDIMFVFSEAARVRRRFACDLIIAYTSLLSEQILRFPPDTDFNAQLRIYLSCRTFLPKGD